MMATLQPLGGSSAAHSFAYWGDRQDWLVALSKHRDSDAIDRSNWDVIVPPIIAQWPDDAAIESFNNWAVGWTAHLLVRPGTPAADEAQRWADKLADYPLADEDAYGILEWNEEWCLRCDRGTREQHGAGLYGTCRKFRGESDRDDIGYRWDARRERRAAKLEGR